MDTCDCIVLIKKTLECHANQDNQENDCVAIDQSHVLVSCVQYVLFPCHLISMCPATIPISLIVIWSLKWRWRQKCQHG